MSHPIESFFSQNDLWPEVCSIINKLKEQNFQAVIVGGAVRDALMEKVPQDFDIATNTHPDQVKKIFPRSQFVGKSFGVIHLPIQNQYVEIATFRKDGQYTDGRHPESVEFTSIEHDAQRRDFTINALYYDIHKKEIIDFFEGQKDIQEKKIRTVGNPNIRFREDYLRLIRALRFSLIFDFEIEKETLKSLQKLMPQIIHISQERVIQEIDKIFLKSNQFLKICLLFLNTGFLQTFWSQISYWEESLNQKFWNYKGESKFLSWCLLFSFMIKKEDQNFKEVLKNSSLSNKKVDQILSSISFYKEWVHPQTRKGKKLRLLNSNHGQLYFEMAQHIQENVFSQKINDEDIVNQYIHQFGEKLPSPFLKGQDLIQLKVESGPQMSILLETIYDDQLEEKIKNKDEALERLQSLIQENLESN